MLDQLEPRPSPGRDVIHVGHQAELSHRRRAVAPADHGECAGISHGLRNCASAGGESLVLEQSHRAVPEDGSGIGDDIVELRSRTGADIEATTPIGQSAAHLAHGAAGIQRGDVAGQDDPGAAPQQPLAGLDEVGLAQRVADLVTHRSQEREAHPSADDQRVDHPCKGFDDAELVADLRAPEHRHERPPGISTQTADHLDLAGQQPAGCARQMPGRSHDGRVSPVAGTEGVIHIAVEGSSLCSVAEAHHDLARNEGVHKCSVVRGFARMKAKVLHHLHARRGCGEPFGYRSEREALVGSSRRSAQVRARRDRRTPFGQPRQRRQCRTDAQVVGDLTATVRTFAQRHVEVAAHEDAAAVEPAELLFEIFQRRQGAAARLQAHRLQAMPTRSTSRFE